jgi:hypothetical protein
MNPSPRMAVTPLPMTDSQRRRLVVTCTLVGDRQIADE